MSAAISLKKSALIAEIRALADKLGVEVDDNYVRQETFVGLMIWHIRLQLEADRQGVAHG